MAARFLNGEVSELCLGKPELRCVAASAAVSDALTALKTCGETHVSVCACGGDGNSIDGGGDGGGAPCVCVGKICVADVILFLCREENLRDPYKAFEARVSDVLPKGLNVVRHLEPNSSLLEAIDYILEGTQNLVIPIKHRQIPNQRKKHLPKQPGFSCTHEYCWLTQEDVIRYLLNSIGAFSPLPTFSLDSLNVINREILTVHYHKPASSALTSLNRALTEQTSIAVVDDEKRFIGEISPFTLACCDESVAGAIMALQAGDLMTYIDCGGPTEDMIHLVKMKLEEKNLGALAELMDESYLQHSAVSTSSSSSCCSSDDEFGSSRNGWSTRSSWSGRPYPARRSEAVVCGPKSSLVAVMIQALAHRVSCVWVVEEDHTLVGTVTFAGMLKVFRNAAK